MVGLYFSRPQSVRAVRWLGKENCAEFNAAYDANAGVAGDV